MYDLLDRKDNTILDAKTDGSTRRILLKLSALRGRSKDAYPEFSTALIAYSTYKLQHCKTTTAQEARHI